MKTKLLWISVAGLAVSAQIVFAGCGSESDDNNAQADGSTVDGGGGGGLSDATGNGTVCDPETGVCTPSPTACVAADGVCASNNQCCTFSCLSGKCSGKQCTPDKAACAADGECCGGKCDNGTCTPLSGSCKTSGNPCGVNGDCCSAFCNAGICGAPSYCAQNGDTCAGDTDCCGGLCTKAAGAALGLCSVASASGTGNCTPAGQLCGAPTTGVGGLPNCGGDCCSRSCRPYAPTGLFICQPPSGCHPTGEICQIDADCCGSPGAPGSTNSNGGAKETDVHCNKAAGAAIGRCDNGNACSPAGAICRLATNSCNATDKCCSGTVQTHPLNCKQDSLGIPRCTAESDYDCAVKGPPPAGTACASSADCCGLPCVPNPNGGGTPAFVCSAAACIPSGGACTTTADCCAGSPCNIPAGSAKGTCGAKATGGSPDGGGTGGTGGSPGGTTCAQYGQQCTVAGDCCDGVPCSGGHCVYPGPN